ncbi:tonB-system energizer ExbB [Methylocapsa acidiphila]|uniref:tonB-system energizer ExbB n=1 Tax=Methylocapsa acidiphila TaxID=133552 RepID=UPI003CC91AB6
MESVFMDKETRRSSPCAAWISGAQSVAAALALLCVTLTVFSASAQAQSPASTSAEPAAVSEPHPDAEAAPTRAAAPEAAAPEAASGAVKPALKAEASLPSSLPRDLTPWGMFRGAVPAVKAVMIGLALASLATWTVWLAKTIELWAAKRKARSGLETLAHAATLKEAEKEFAETRGPVARLVSAAVGELDRSKGLPPDGVKERAVALLSRIEARAGRSITRGTGVLATIGATAPFVGLFGTVWGIMDSFIGISKTNTTNLAVVAPGIAEALLATAMGLFAAIPAVVIYNVFARAITGYRAQLADASAEVLRHLSRDIDRESQPRRKEDSPVVPIRQPAE